MTSHTLSSNNFAPYSVSERTISSGFNNLLSSIRTYADMSPDFAIRRQINTALKARPRQLLTEYAWCELFAEDLAIANEDRVVAMAVLQFAYQRFSEYTGIDFGRVRPSDRLIEDLQLPLVCWFDWALTFCEDFLAQLCVDISDRFDETEFETAGELITYLVDQVAAQSAVTAPTAVRTSCTFDRVAA